MNMIIQSIIPHIRFHVYFYVLQIKPLLDYNRHVRQTIKSGYTSCIRQLWIDVSDNSIMDNKDTNNEHESFNDPINWKSSRVSFRLRTT
jgi:hypothetical protein